MATENNSGQITEDKNDNDKKIVAEQNNDEINVNDNLSNVNNTGSKSKKKKKSKNKKKSVTESTTDDKIDLDEVVEHILSENPSTSKTCSVPNCKQTSSASSAVMNLTCQYCNMKYCMKHRHPEAHSPKCVEKARKAAHSNFKQESIHVITEERKNPGLTNTKNFSVNKSKEELKKRYREKLDKARRNERGG